MHPVSQGVKSRRPSIDFAATLERMEIDILSGLLRPRERLVEIELSERYGVSRGMIRRVLKELEFRHLVRHTSNRGATVAEPSRKEMEDIYAARLLLEDHAIDAGMKAVDKETIRGAVSAARGFENAVARGDLREILDSNRIFHRTIFDACNNQVLCELIDHVRRRCHLWQHYIVGFPERIRQTILEHKAMIECLKKRDAHELKRLNRQHLAGGFKSYMEDLRMRYGEQ